ncbi:hypothetical protein ACHQM5_010547 [Ranunculus cassubicifolius]
MLLLNNLQVIVKQPPMIKCSGRFSPWFENCVGAIDGTHIRVSVPERIRNKFRGRKTFPTQNVLAAISFDLQFTYVLAGWEGSAHDARVLEDSLKIDNRLKVPEGKYYLVDAVNTNQKGFLAPFRGTRYHLNEWDVRRPQNPNELFNHRHSSLRNTVERTFGVLKKRWKILDDSEPYFSYETQVDLVLACCILHNHIQGIDPNDIFFAEVEQEMEVQATQIAQEHMQAQVDRYAQKKEYQKVRHTQRREQRQDKKEWKAFRAKMADDMWTNYKAR